MARSTVKCPDITIANGATISNVVQYNLIHEDADSIMLFGQNIDPVPASYQIQVNELFDGSGTWVTLTDGTNPILAPFNGKAATYPFINMTFRIVASQNTAQICTWKMNKSLTVLWH